MLLPGYRPTPLTSADRLAKKVGVKNVWVKEESARLGLPAFKILGASWAVYRYFYERFGDVVQGAVTLRDMGERIRPHGRWRLVTATDGNHGRGVARVAQWLGIEAEIFVPQGTKAFHEVCFMV